MNIVMIERSVYLSGRKTTQRQRKVYELTNGSMERLIGWCVEQGYKIVSFDYVESVTKRMTVIENAIKCKILAQGYMHPKYETKYTWI